MIYNQQKHIQLLKRDQDFKNQGKSFYKESPEESFFKQETKEFVSAWKLTQGQVSDLLDINKNIGDY